MDMGLLTQLTLIADYLVLVIAVWMAMYIIGHGYPNRIAVRGVVVLLAIAFYSYDAITASLALSQTSSSLAVQQVTIMIALVAGFHFIHAILPSGKAKEIMWVQYLVTGVGLIGTMLFLRSSELEGNNRLFVEHVVFTPSILAVGVIQVFIASAIFYGTYLLVVENNFPRNRSLRLSLILGISTIAYGILALVLRQSLPRIIPTLLIMGSILTLGYSVAIHQALLERRVSVRDLPITLISISGITGVYVLAAWQSGLSTQRIALLSVMAIVSHSLFDLIRQSLKRIFQVKDRQYIQEIRSLVRKSNEDSKLRDSLRKSLAIICYNLKASGGFIAVRDADVYVILASYHSLSNGTKLKLGDIGDKIGHPSGELGKRVEILVPVFSASNKIGSLGLASRANLQDYSEEDRFWLEDVADQIGSIVHAFSQNGTKRGRIAIGTNDEEVKNKKTKPDEMTLRPAEKTDPELVKLVEEGFRNLYDFMVLGTSPLSEILNANGDTHIEVGKTVKEILISTLSTLRPAEVEPPEPLPREWHSYTILHDAYVEDVPDRDIMGKLYISEGTFYRTRRKALRGVTRAIVETLSKA